MQIGVSFAYDVMSMNERRKWNEQYGEIGNKKQSPFSFVKKIIRMHLWNKYYLQATQSNEFESQFKAYVLDAWVYTALQHFFGKSFSSTKLVS